MYVIRFLSLFALLFCFTAFAQQPTTSKKKAKTATEKIVSNKSTAKKTYAPPKKKKTIASASKKKTVTPSKKRKVATHRPYAKKRTVASAKKRNKKTTKAPVQYAENTATTAEDLEEDLEDDDLMEEPEALDAEADIAITTLSEAKEATTQQKLLLDTAFSYLGTPYRHGGVTRKGMDCSGFVSTAFKSIDIPLSRSSQEMATQGKKIKLENVKVGDLLFFKTLRNKKRISHVGMVVDVEGGEVKFIHASSKRGVVISSMSDAYYKKAFRIAKRVM